MLLAPLSILHGESAVPAMSSPTGALFFSSYRILEGFTTNPDSVPFFIVVNSKSELARAVGQE